MSVENLHQMWLAKASEPRTVTMTLTEEEAKVIHGRRRKLAQYVKDTKTQVEARATATV